MDDEIDVIEKLQERGVTAVEIDVAKIMLGVDPLTTRGLTPTELHVMGIIGY